MSTETRGFTLKGWHVLAIFIGAYVFIITANMTLAVSAVRTFPGLEVPNSYIASQSFDDRRAAQEALGWTVAVDLDGNRPVVAITDADGAPVMAQDVAIRIGRPTHGREDIHLAFERFCCETALDAQLAPGQWRIDIEAHAADGTLHDTRHVVTVR
ncbi:MAG: FixH family protein [Rubricella sp.]